MHAYCAFILIDSVIVCIFVQKNAHFKLELGNIPSKNISSPKSITFLKKSFTFYNLNSESELC